MKNKIGFLLLVLIASIQVGNAQPGQRLSIEERVKIVHEKLDSAFKLDAAKLVQTDSIFANYYRQQEKVFQDLRNAGGGFDREAIMEKMQPLTDARDKELKAVLTADQFTKWKDEIEPSMRPRRRN